MAEAIENAKLSIDDIDNLLKEDEPAVVEKKEEKPKKEEKELELADDDEVVEESEGEAEEITIDEENLELTTPVKRKEILAKYPNLFKDFPYLQTAYYREQQYTEILPTIDDAKEAVEKAEHLDTFEAHLLSGSTEEVLKLVKANDNDAFMKIVDNYLPNLAKVDKDAYYHVVGNVIRDTIVAMVRDARASSDDNLQGAAAILNKFIFGTSEFSESKPLSKRVPNDEADKLAAERKEFAREKFEVTQNELNTKINNTLKNTIVQNIDPKDSMSEYVKKNATREALESLDKVLSEDKRFTSIIDKLWEKAADENFSRTAVDKIRAAYLSKAKTVLPSVIKQARNEALRGLGKRVVDNEDDKKGHLPVGRNVTQNRSSDKKPGAIPKGMKTLDFLNSD